VKEYDLPAPSGVTPDQIEAAILEFGLLITLRGTRRQYPGCDHWHIKRPNEPGTIELTWWPERSRLWFKIATNREAAWMDRAMDQIQSSIVSDVSDGSDGF
jgi:hypothetical protein